VRGAFALLFSSSRSDRARVCAPTDGRQRARRNVRCIFRRSITARKSAFLGWSRSHSRDELPCVFFETCETRDIQLTSESHVFRRSRVLLISSRPRIFLLDDLASLFSSSSSSQSYAISSTPGFSYHIYIRLISFRPKSQKLLRPRK